MNWPAPASAVTSDHRHQHRVGERRRARRAATSAAGRTPSGIARRPRPRPTSAERGDREEGASASRRSRRSSARDRHAEHRGHRPAEEDEGDRAGRAASGRRHAADRRRRLRREHGGAEHGERAHRQQRGVARHQRAERVADRVPERATAASSLLRSKPADPAGEQRRAEAHDDGGDRDQLAGDGDRDLQRVAPGRSACRPRPSRRSRWRSCRTAAPSAPGDGARATAPALAAARSAAPARRLAHRRTLSASGLTMLRRLAAR